MSKPTLIRIRDPKRASTFVRVLSVAFTALAIAGAARAQENAPSQNVAAAIDAPRFAVADVHPSRGDVDEDGSATIELGPQYRLSPTVTLGGWLEPHDIGADTGVNRERYVFGLRISR